jgi:hypothetical protein
LSVSSVGSDDTSGSTSEAAGEPRSSTRASNASRSVAASSCCVSSVSDREVAIGRRRSGIASSPVSPLATSANSGSTTVRGAMPATAARASPGHRPTARPAAAANPVLRRVVHQQFLRGGLGLRHELPQVAAELQVLSNHPSRDEQHGEP